MTLKALETAAIKMMQDFEMTSVISHNGEKGTAREELLVEVLEKYLPEKYKIGRGIIIDAKGEQSRQQDLAVYDAFSSPILANLRSTELIPIESVYATIEVKSSLNKNELIKSIRNIESVRSLSKHAMTPKVSPTIGIVFSFTSDTSLDALVHNLKTESEKIHYNHRLSFICVLDKGLIIQTSKKGFEEVTLIPSENSTPAIIENSIENNLLLFYLLLMEYLNNTQISPPNLIKYAEYHGLLSLKMKIPKKSIPEGATLNFSGHNIPIDPQTTEKFFKLAKRFESGRANKNELIDYIKFTFTKMFKPNAPEITFFGKKIPVSYLLQVIELHDKLETKQQLTEQENVELSNGIERLYSLYKNDSK